MRPLSLLRRLFQFRLRTLLLAVLVLSLTLGSYVRRVELQRQAVAAVRTAGGDAFYDHEIAAGKLDFQDPSPVPTALVDRLGIDFFHAVVRVDVGPSVSSPDLQAMDRAIARLPDLPRLKHLVLADASDERLRAAATLAHLERLAIFDERGRVSSDGIKELRHMSRLKHLWIAGVTGLNDDTLQVISTLPELETVSMIGPTTLGSKRPDFTDRGLTLLARLKNLKVLRLDCDEHQLARLKEALPDCEVTVWCALDTGTE